MEYKIGDKVRVMIREKREVRSQGDGEVIKCVGDEITVLVTGTYGRASYNRKFSKTGKGKHGLFLEPLV